MFAEDYPYWDTVISPSDSMEDIEKELERFQASRTLITKARVDNSVAWIVRFEWNEKSFRFLFRPLTCQYPYKTSSFANKRREHIQQAVYQMGRIAFYFVKAVLTAAATDPAALFGFMEVSGSNPGKLPAIMSEIDTTLLRLPRLAMPEIETEEP